MHFVTLLNLSIEFFHSLIVVTDHLTYLSDYLVGKGFCLLSVRPVMAIHLNIS